MINNFCKVQAFISRDHRRAPLARLESDGVRLQRILCYSVSAGTELLTLMELPDNVSELAVWAVRMRVCSTCGPLGNAVGSTPPPAIGAWLRAHLPTAVAAALDRFATPPPLACINLVSVLYSNVHLLNAKLRPSTDKLDDDEGPQLLK